MGKLNQYDNQSGQSLLLNFCSSKWTQIFINAWCFLEYAIIDVLNEHPPKYLILSLSYKMLFVREYTTTNLINCVTIICIWIGYAILEYIMNIFPFVWQFPVTQYKNEYFVTGEPL